MSKWILLTGAIFCAAAVIIGAFGAHALKPLLDLKGMDWVETGARYQTTHGLALLACGLIAGKGSARTAVLFVLGIILFSGSLYIMALTNLTTLGIITPMGGLCFILGWASFGAMAWSLDDKATSDNGTSDSTTRYNATSNNPTSKKV